MAREQEENGAILSSLANDEVRPSGYPRARLTGPHSTNLHAPKSELDEGQIRALEEHEISQGSVPRASSRRALTVAPGLSRCCRRRSRATPKF